MIGTVTVTPSNDVLKLHMSTLTTTEFQQALSSALCKGLMMSVGETALHHIPIVIEWNGKKVDGKICFAIENKA